MKKIIGLMLLAILFADASNAEESQGEICENNGGRWLWNSGNNQWYCDKSGYLKSQESSFEAMKRECRNGKAQACGLVGSMFVEGKDTDGNKIPQNIPFGMQLVTTSCNAGDISACTSLGGFYRDGQYIQEDKFKATKIFKTICDIGSNEFGSSSGLACFQLGIMTERGEAVPKDKYKALELYNKSCTLGIGHGCTFARYLKEK